MANDTTETGYKTLTASTQVKVGRDTYTLSDDVAAALELVDKKKSKTYLLKAECPECGYNIRITRKQINRGGLPCCPSCSDYDSGYIVPLALEIKD